MTAYIKRRQTQTGTKYYVYYRITAAHKERYAGSFTTKKDAQTRLDVIRGELAALRDPAHLLADFKRPRPQQASLQERWDAFIASRVDVGVKAQNQYRNARDRWLPLLGATTDPATITPDDVIAGVARMTAGQDDEKPLAPSTVQQYVSNLAMVFDFADVHPNPVRSRKVKLPAQSKGERAIPTNQAWDGIKQGIRRRSRLTVRLMEACGLRVSEACSLQWGDIDFQAGMLRIRREATKTSSGRRWVPVPPELLAEVDGLRALEDRLPAGRVLGVKPTEVAYDLAQACVFAGVSRFSTHALRHRRISLWVRHGIDPKQASLWAGHSKPTETMNTYSHQVLDPAGDEWRMFWRGVYEGRGVEVEAEA